MKKAPFSLRRCAVALSLLLQCLLFTVPLMGQNGTWVEVMVNGPWDYVLDYSAVPAHPRIVLISPQSLGHGKPVVFAGPDASAPPSSPKTLDPQKYDLVIDKVREKPNCPTGQPSSGSMYAYPTHVPKQNIQAAVDGTAIDPDTKQLMPRFAIVLPTPCYFTTMQEDRSKMGITPIASQGEEAYATWTSLHYYVDNPDPSKITATIDNTAFTFTSPASSSPYPPSLSLLIASTSNAVNDNECDSLSLESVQNSAKLLGLAGEMYAQFPELLGSGATNHQTHLYSSNPKCVLPASGPMTVTHRPTSDPKACVCLTSAGSGDCHKAQININGALN